jgi:ankyrin repeat protein
MEHIKEFKDIYYPKINSKNYELIAAVDDGDIKEMKKLLSEGADINFQDEKYGWTPIMYCKFYSMLIELIRAGADLNIKTHDDGSTVLIINSYNKKTKEMKKLISCGADMNIKNNKGQDFYDVASSDIKKWIFENYPEFVANK